MSGSSSLSIRVYLVDRTVSEFAVDDPAIIPRIVAQAHPTKVFAQRALIIGGRTSLTVLPCTAITRLELGMAGFPNWPFTHGVQDIHEISEAEFGAHYAPAAGDEARAEREIVPGEVVGVCNEIVTSDGNRMFMEIHTQARQAALDRAMLVQHLLSAPSFYAVREDGVVLLNPANIVRSTLFPGPSDSPMNAWPARAVQAA